MFKLLTTIFAGPAGVVTEWFTSMFGKIIGVLAILALITAGATSVYFTWRNDVQSAEASKFEVAKRDQVIANQKKQIQTLTDLNTLQSQTIEKQTADQAAIDAQSKSVQDWLASQNTKPTAKPVVSSDILTQTFDHLYGKSK